MKKKGVELSMNVIIIAAIGLLILLILAFLVVNYVGKTNEGLKSCSVAYGGICKEDCGQLGYATQEQTDCKQGTYCCKVVG
ncbi:MAG: hypothetical protein KatS3mg002_0484 [Candidatus Woesearchaeota archaeon]|nr:MAG: hypothetical protein KatS3mg002_0484 [Candidatus Woesearchaeota archaeon]